MANPTVALTRIDNRLIHGQVASQWTRETKADILLVASDETAADKFRQELMNMAAPAGVTTMYVPVDDVKKVLEEKCGDKRVMILVANPLDAKRLQEAGVKIERLNIGNMHMAEGKHQVATTVAVDDTDKAYLKQLADNGAELFIQRVPGSPEEPLEKLWK